MPIKNLNIASLFISIIILIIVIILIIMVIYYYNNNSNSSTNTIFPNIQNPKLAAAAAYKYKNQGGINRFNDPGACINNQGKCDRGIL